MKEQDNSRQYSSCYQLQKKLPLFRIEIQTEMLWVQPLDYIIFY